MIVKTPALLALFGVIFVAGVKYAAVAETQTSTFADGRNGKTCRTVVIGGKTWMAENMNVATVGSWCYDNKEYNCKKYGRLYNWKAANTVCPAGWHLPSREEWGDLAKAAGGRRKYGTGGKAGKKLKSKSGWMNNGNGTDDYGFSALPGGYRYYTVDSFYGAGHGYWWTATEQGIYSAYYRSMYYGNGAVYEGVGYESGGFSVRCVGGE
jgi:uncharacterized protein (TIGR02145 family)